MENTRVSYIFTLIRRYTQNVYSKQEAEEFLDSLHTQQKKLVEEEMDHVWEETLWIDSLCGSSEKHKEEARRLLKRINKKEQKLVIRPFLKYAAAIVIFLMAGLTYFLLPDKEKELQARNMVIETRQGEWKSLYLPDGTHITLNACTRLVYPEKFVTTERKIEIDGEAFLDVYADAEKPFIIHTQTMDVKVLGTSFNIKAYETDEQLSVSVKSGKVSISLPEAVFSLVANEELIWDKESDEFYKNKQNIHQAISWIHGGLYFNRTPIGAVVRELQRIYDKQILFEEGVNIKEYIYGAHENKSLESVLTSIQYTTGIQYRKENEVFILYK
ncbi:MAG: FecR domain-containing protein [Tannerellaceae bacterium]|nr:FecR domain-containing protein [Tannerellaceae bacterium]